MQISSSIKMIFVYNALATYGGDVAVAAFGAIIKVNFPSSCRFWHVLWPAANRRV